MDYFGFSIAINAHQTARIYMWVYLERNMWKGARFSNPNPISLIPIIEPPLQLCEFYLNCTTLDCLPLRIHTFLHPSGSGTTFTGIRGILKWHSILSACKCGAASVCEIFIRFRLYGTIIATKLVLKLRLHFQNDIYTLLIFNNVTYKVMREYECTWVWPL